MSHRVRFLLALPFVILTACDAETSPDRDIGEVEHPPTFRSAEAHCDALTIERYDALVETIGDAMALATTDVENHGETGAYAVAPQYALDSLEAAHAEATHYRDYFASWPVVYPGVAYNLRFRGVQESMWYAGHWANVSAVYHASEEARQVHALTEEIVQQADSLRADAGRCYMDWYFEDESP
jgi:hypothetical protein